MISGNGTAQAQLEVYGHLFHKALLCKYQYDLVFTFEGSCNSKGWCGVCNWDLKCSDFALVSYCICHRGRCLPRVYLVDVLSSRVGTNPQLPKRTGPFLPISAWHSFVCFSSFSSFLDTARDEPKLTLTSTSVYLGW